jgi:hypothetical protein
MDEVVPKPVPSLRVSLLLKLPGEVIHRDSRPDRAANLVADTAGQAHPLRLAFLPLLEVMVAIAFFVAAHVPSLLGSLLAKILPLAGVHHVSWACAIVHEKSFPLLARDLILNLAGPQGWGAAVVSLASVVYLRVCAGSRCIWGYTLWSSWHIIRVDFWEVISIEERQRSRDSSESNRFILRLNRDAVLGIHWVTFIPWSHIRIVARGFRALIVRVSRRVVLIRSCRLDPVLFDERLAGTPGMAGLGLKVYGRRSMFSPRHGMGINAGTSKCYLWASWWRNPGRILGFGNISYDFLASIIALYRGQICETPSSEGDAGISAIHCCRPIRASFI